MPPQSTGRNEALENAILKLLSRRREGTTICPSEAARAFGGETWRGLMDDVRDAAWRLEAEGKAVILQKGKAVTRHEARGPVRIGLPRGTAKR